MGPLRCKFIYPSGLSRAEGVLSVKVLEGLVIGVNGEKFCREMEVDGHLSSA